MNANRDQLVADVLDQVKAQLPAWIEAVRKWLVGRAVEEVQALADRLKGSNGFAALTPIVNELDADAFDAWVKLVAAAGQEIVAANVQHVETQRAAGKVVLSIVLAIIGAVLA